MDGRPPPPSPTPGSGPRRLATSASVTTRKAAGKAGSECSAGNARPSEHPYFAGLVVQHWRDVPELLDPIRRLPIIDERWIDRVLRSEIEPSTTAVSAGEHAAGRDHLTATT